MFSTAYFFLWASGCTVAALINLFCVDEKPNDRFAATLIPIAITLLLTAAFKAIGMSPE